MNRTLAPFRPIVWILAAVLVASLAALPASRAQARDLVETDTYLDLADDEPALGDTITITAFVERADDEEGAVAGQVRFGAGTAEVGSFGTTLGQAPLVDGEANLEFTVDESALPAGTTDSFYVVAEYLGTDAFAASTSDSVRIEITPTDPTDPVATTIEVTGPADADSDVTTTLTAAVLPAEATGVVTFVVDGNEVGSADVDAGAASLDYAFPGPGDNTSIVVAAFAPDDADQYLPSTSPDHEVYVYALPSYAPPFTWKPTIGFGLGCRPAAPAAGPPARLVNPFTTFINFDFPDFLPLFTSSPFFSYFNNFMLKFEACIFGSIFVGPFTPRAETTVPVDCVPTETGYQCRFDLPGPPSSMTIEPVIPVPAEFAGQSIAVSTTVTQVDPETGETSTILDETTNLDVPERTTLSGKLAPVKSGVTSVQRGKAVAYRLNVQNMGIVTADGVKACVSVGKGAAIKTAKGATVKGRQACWTLPILTSTKSAARTLTVVAPKKAGELKLNAVVTPKRSQADPVRLSAALPVR